MANKKLFKGFVRNIFLTVLIAGTGIVLCTKVDIKGTSLYKVLRKEPVVNELVITSEGTNYEFSVLDEVYKPYHIIDIFDKDYRVDKVVNEEKISEILDLFYVESSDASVEFSNGIWTLTPEVQGYEFDKDMIHNYISNIIKQSDECEINLDTYVHPPHVLEHDMKPYYDKVSWMNNFCISYTTGLKIDCSYLREYVNDLLELDIEPLCDSVITQLKESINTKETDMKFNPTDSEEPITVKYGTFGKVLKEQSEKEHLIEIITNHESEENRVPLTQGYDVFDDTYIEVSINKQHAWYYKDGELVSDTDIVTGTKGKHDTPTGVYYISECIPGKYLKGDGYKTWVDRWMRLTNRGVGLHDAGWRGSFGKSIYTYSGSHGCINLPKKYAYDLYKEAYVGMPVVIY